MHSNPFAAITPEALYADTRTKIGALASLSERYAADQNAYMAVHAAWAADLHAVQAVLWEHVLVASPRTVETYLAIRAGIDATLSASPGLGQGHQAGPGGGEATTALNVAREGLLGAFQDAAAAAIRARLIDTDHLQGLTVGTDDSQQVVAARCAQVPAPLLATARVLEARNGIADAQTLADAGSIASARVVAFAADWAGLEGYLLASAAEAGDSDLITVELRWDLCADVVFGLAAIPADWAEGVGAVRAAMRAALGPVEGPRLDRWLAPLT